jgi:hypothetical protein
MQTQSTRTDEINQAPALFREALAELVQIGMTVARMIGRVAQAETALADAAATVADGGNPVATSLAEAIAADQAASAAAEARRDVVARTERVAAAFDQVSRAVRRTVMLAERLDRGWARPIRVDDRQTMAHRQTVRAVRERLDSLDRPDDLGDRPVEEIIRAICRDLGLDPAEVLPKFREHPSWPMVLSGAPPHAPPGDRRPLDTSG